MVMKGDLTWGGEHTVQCTDDVLQNCAPATCKILVTSVTPINSIKRKKKDFKHNLYLEKLAKDCIYQMFIVKSSGMVLNELSLKIKKKKLNRARRKKLQAE